MAQVEGVTMEEVRRVVEGESTTTPLNVEIRANTSYNIENVMAILQPFYWPSDAGNDESPLFPTFITSGLLFPFSVGISEQASPKYESVNISQANESFMNFSGKDNVNIGLSGCTWVCDTFENATYALSALHFLRSYSLMDFGRKRTGRPPSPMWFSAYGNFMYDRIPVLMRNASWNFPADIDYVGIPQPGTSQWNNRELSYDRNTGDRYTWMPIKFTAEISLTVQHSPKYWTDFNLEDVFSGKLLNVG